MNIANVSAATFRRVLKSTLALSISLSTPAPLGAAVIDRSAAPDFNFRDLQNFDPTFKEFAREAWAPPTMPNWARRDLDRDPYFMASQSFTNPIGDGRDARTAFNVTAQGLQIQVPGVNRALQIEQNLKPLFELDDYVFLRAGDDAMFRERFAERDPEYSEGLFFIDKQYVYAELARGANVERRPVPVFFLPLPGRWTGTVTHAVAEPYTTIALRNDRDAVTTIDLATIRRLAQGLHRQVQIATMIALKHDPDARPGAGPITFRPPPPGSTALFGTFLTGIDLTHPERGLVDAPSDAVATAFDHLRLLPRAHALVMSPDLWDRLARVAIITSNVWILGTALQYTRLRARMLERRSYIEGKEDELRPAGEPAPDRTKLGYRVKRAARENIDVFSTGLAVLATGPDTVAGYVTEYLADKSGFRFARNGWFRKAQAHTFLFSRAQNEGINVNWKAFYLGVAILGTIDTAGVTLQLLWATPFILPWVASFVSEHQHQRALEQFSGHNANTNNLVTSEIMRNLSLHFVQGSYAYARDQRNALMEVVRPQVEREFQLMGKSIQSAVHRAQYEAEIKRRVEKLLVQRELPPEKEFLFSSPSVVRTLLGTMGYRVDRERLQTSVDFVGNGAGAGTKANESADDEDHGPTFALETARQGNVVGALKLARVELDARHARYPERAEFVRAERILAELQRRFHVLRLMARDPRRVNDIAREGNKVRQILTLLSQDGPVTQGLRYLDLWAPADPAPLRRLIELKHDVQNAAARDGVRLARADVFKEVRRRARDDGDEVGRAFDIYAGRGRTFEAQLTELEADHRDGVLGAAVRDPVAAEIAGRAFHQALQGMIADRPDYLRPKDEDVVRYGPEAKIEATARIQAAPRHIGFDQTDVELETMNVIKERVEDAVQAKKNAEWRPALRFDLIARLQDHRAHRAGLREVQRQLGATFVPRNREFPITDPEIQPIYAEAYRRARASQVGLHAIEGPRYEDEVRDLTDIIAAINAVSDRWYGRAHPGSLTREAFISGEIDAELASKPSALARHRTYRRDNVDVLTKLKNRRAELALNERARVYAEEKVARNFATNGGWNAYLARLDEGEKVRFLTRQYADAYLTRYGDLTVGTTDVVPQTSPAQPGFFQAARQIDAMGTGSTFANVLTTTMRILESPFDASSNGPGTVAMLKRRVPFLQDAMSDTVQRVKRFGIFMAITWPMQWYLWGVHFDAPTVLLFYGTAGSLAVAHYWVDRMLVNIGKPPMADTWSKIKYSLLITTATYPTYIPFFLMEEGWREFYVRSIETPFLQWAALAQSHLTGAVAACQSLLSSVF